MVRLFVLIFLLSNQVLSQVPEEVIIAGDQWCPYVCNDQKMRGFSVELVEQALALSKIKTKYTNSSFLRLLKNIENGEWHVVTGTNKVFSPNLLISKVPVAYTKWVFVTLKDSRWRYDGIDSLKEITLGTVGGYVYSPDTTAYIEKYKDSIKVAPIFGYNPQKVNLQKLILGRIDVFIGDEAVINYWATQLGISDSLKIAGIDYEIPLFCGLPPKAHKLSEIIDQGIRQFKETPQFDDLKKKYKIINWASD